MELVSGYESCNSVPYGLTPIVTRYAEHSQGADEPAYSEQKNQHS
jgi:hypothetical protein